MTCSECDTVLTDLAVALPTGKLSVLISYYLDVHILLQTWLPFP
jgi:hypothetical protein